MRAELALLPKAGRTSSGRTVHGDRRPAGPYRPAECMNGRRPVWHGWAGPNRAPCLLPIAPWSLHPYVSRESAADRTWLVDRRLLLKAMTGPSRLMYVTTRVSKRRLNSTADKRGGARHANPRFTAVAVVGWSSSSEAHDGRFRRICGLSAYRRSPHDPGWQPWPGRRPGRGCSGSTILMNVRVPTTHRTSSRTVRSPDDGRATNERRSRAACERCPLSCPLFRLSAESRHANMNVTQYRQ